MITKTAAFQTSDGETHPNLAAAQSHEITTLLESLVLESSTSHDDISCWIVTNSEKLLDILTTKPTSKVRARKINGGTKKRMATSATPAA